MSKWLKKEFKAMLPYLIVLGMLFYAIPVPAMFDITIGNSGFFIYMLLIINPAACFVATLLFAIKYGFHWLFPPVISLIFVPTIFIYYNYTAIIYVFSYCVLSYIGSVSGYLIHKNNNK